jgi:hypothetical protein
MDGGSFKGLHKGIPVKSLGFYNKVNIIKITGAGVVLGQCGKTSGTGGAGQCLAGQCTRDVEDG